MCRYWGPASEPPFPVHHSHGCCQLRKARPLRTAHRLCSHTAIAACFQTVMYSKGAQVLYDCPTLGWRVLATVVGLSLAGPQHRHIRYCYAMDSRVIDNQNVPYADVVCLEAVLGVVPSKWKPDAPCKPLSAAEPTAWPPLQVPPDPEHSSTFARLCAMWKTCHCMWTERLRQTSVSGKGTCRKGWCVRGAVGTPGGGRSRTEWGAEERLLPRPVVLRVGWH